MAKVGERSTRSETGFDDSRKANPDVPGCKRCPRISHKRSFLTGAFQNSHVHGETEKAIDTKSWSRGVFVFIRLDLSDPCPLSPVGRDGKPFDRPRWNESSSTESQPSRQFLKDSTTRFGISKTNEFPLTTMTACPLREFTKGALKNLGCGFFVRWRECRK